MIRVLPYSAVQRWGPQVPDERQQLYDSLIPPEVTTLRRARNGVLDALPKLGLTLEETQKLTQDRAALKRLIRKVEVDLAGWTEAEHQAAELKEKEFEKEHGWLLYVTFELTDEQAAVDASGYYDLSSFPGKTVDKILFVKSREIDPTVGFALPYDQFHVQFTNGTSVTVSGIKRSAEGEIWMGKGANLRTCPHRPATKQEVADNRGCW